MGFYTDCISVESVLSTTSKNHVTFYFGNLSSNYIDCLFPVMAFMILHLFFFFFFTFFWNYFIDNSVVGIKRSLVSICVRRTYGGHVTTRVWWVFLGDVQRFTVSTVRKKDRIARGSKQMKWIKHLVRIKEHKRHHLALAFSSDTYYNYILFDFHTAVLVIYAIVSLCVTCREKYIHIFW